MAGDSQDKTETASARRLERAREQGDIPVSKEVSLLAGLAGGSAVIIAQGGVSSRQAALHWFATQLQNIGREDHPLPIAALLQAAGPPMFGALLAITAAGALQTGFLFRPAALQPDLSRISPARGIKRIFSIETLVQAGKSLVKLGVLAFLLWLALRRLLPTLHLALGWSPAALMASLLAEAWRLLLALAGAQTVLTLFDLFWVRLQHAAKMRMSKQEQRDEHKDTEGNPLVKQRLRQLARIRAKRRMMAAVKRAAVVITNPTHYAVALAYERGSRAAPRVVAKGMDEVAARIREEARLHHIPLVANAPLARALCRVELDAEIPLEHFKAVAEIVAFIWRMRGRPRL